MTRDLNKDITNIEYNHLNLPTYVVINGGVESGEIFYRYNAVGVKVKKLVEAEEPITTLYLDGFQYENDQLKFFPQPEGYVKLNAETQKFEYIYNYTDHLGNVRLAYQDKNNDGVIAQTEILEENNYYPFGLKHEGYNGTPSESSSNNKYKYQYNGQEYQDELGLNWLTYRYRNYDPSIGRFFGVDPITEKYYNISTYQFAHNNPVWKIEIEGLEGKPKTNQDISSEAGNNERDAHKKIEERSKWLAFRSGAPYKWSHSARVVSNRFTNRAPTKDGGNDDIVLKRDGPVGVDASGKDQSDRGSQRGAYRHATWQAFIAQEFNREDAKFVGDTHEGGAVDVSQRNNIDGIFQADQVADELNNRIGRNYGIENKDQNWKEIAVGLLDTFKEDGLFTITKNEDGTFNVVRTKITQEQYNQLKERFKTLTETGYDRPKESRHWNNTCFVAGTKILMSDGTEKNIEDIQEGDKIKSVDINTFEIEEDIIKVIPDTEEYYTKIAITLDNGAVTYSSPHHPFYVKNKGWAVYDVEMAKKDLNFDVQQLEEGDVVLVYDKGKLQEHTIKSLTNTQRKVKMYNLKYVQKNNTFFANGILVHNRYNTK